ncbi:MAG: 3-deoxy-7-phosphoheptulonate synthase [Armatimonadota bacterium]
MVIVMHPGAPRADIDAVIEKVEELGFTPHPIFGVEKTVVAVVGEGVHDATDIFESLRSVDRAVPIGQPYKLAGSDVTAEKSVVRVGDVPIGGEKLAVIAGPCAIESREQFLETAKMVKSHGVHLVRGSAFKPRTSPHDFQGLGQEGLELLAEIKQELGIYLVNEVMEPGQLDAMEGIVDMLQIGARNMQNFSLLSAAGRSGLPVLLKRGISATVDDFLKAAEYIMVAGNHDVVLCERGIRTFETATRFTLDLSVVPVVQRLSHLPILVDPSHAAGHHGYVAPLAMAAVAVGADGLIIETHYRPDQALCDGPQALAPDAFAEVMRALPPFAEAAGRSI